MKRQLRPMTSSRAWPVSWAKASLAATMRAPGACMSATMIACGSASVAAASISSHEARSVDALMPSIWLATQRAMLSLSTNAPQNASYLAVTRSSWPGESRDSYSSRTRSSAFDASSDLGLTNAKNASPTIGSAMIRRRRSAEPSDSNDKRCIASAVMLNAHAKSFGTPDLVFQMVKAAAHRRSLAHGPLRCCTPLDMPVEPGIARAIDSINLIEASQASLLSSSS
mmetsp:Transcript_10851/g.31839  ORF Transcript_10851/g.31839 Transcript_10851/m.31839 type:complete len:226 (+) Transcript_10851:1828-2505(+)